MSLTLSEDPEDRFSRDKAHLFNRKFVFLCPENKIESHCLIWLNIFYFYSILCTYMYSKHVKSIFNTMQAYKCDSEESHLTYVYSVLYQNNLLNSNS